MSENVTPVRRINQLLATDSIKSRFNELLGKRSAGFISSILSLVNSNKMLAECEPQSVINAAAIAATFDLPINPNLGFAYIVPYREKGVAVAQFQMGWKGFVQLAMRSGQYKTMNASPVFEGQIHSHNPFTGEFEFELEAKSDKVIGYVFYFKLINGFEKFTYMTREDAEKHAKKFSQSYKKGYGVWKDDFDSMALKTVVKAGLSKWGILSIDMQKAIEFDQGEVVEAEVVRYPDNPQVTSASESGETEKKTRRIDALVAATKPASPVAETPPSVLLEDEKFPFEKEAP